VGICLFPSIVPPCLDAIVYRLLVDVTSSLGGDDVTSGDEADDELDDVDDDEDQLGDAVCGVGTLAFPVAGACRREGQVQAGRPRGDTRHRQGNVRRCHPRHLSEHNVFQKTTIVTITVRGSDRSIVFTIVALRF